MENIKNISVDSLKNFFNTNNTVNTVADLDNLYNNFCSEIEPLSKTDFLDICCYFLFDYCPEYHYNYNPQLYNKIANLNLELDWEEN